MPQFSDKWQTAKRLRLSPATLKKYRLKGTWIENVHWVRLNSRCIRYNLDLIEDWIHNQHNPIAHQRAIELHQASLLSNQRKPRRRG
jgi:hypothetical protein